MQIEFNFKWIGNKYDAGEVQRRVERILSEYFSDVVDYKLISTTCMSFWLVIIIDFPSQLTVTEKFERILDAIAGAVVYVLDGNVRYRHYEVIGRTASLAYHKDWRKPKIALNVIAKDEGKYIREFIEKHKFWFDDVVVVIDRSTQDNTADEAKAAGARVFFEDLNDDFSRLRNRALEETDPTCEWIFKLDVDEEIDIKLLEKMRDLIKRYGDKYDAFEFTVQNLETKDEFPQVRLFKRKEGVRWEGKVHEVIRGIEKAKTFKTYKIRHYQRWIAEGKIEERNKFYRRLEAMNK